MARRKATGIAAPEEDRYPYVPDVNGPEHMQIIADESAKRSFFYQLIPYCCEFHQTVVFKPSVTIRAENVGDTLGASSITHLI